jgi:ribosomal protein L35
MPKLKTHKATAKWFKITGRGKLRRQADEEPPAAQEEQAR